MTWNKRGKWLTICEYHRRIYRAIAERDPDDPVLDDLKEAYKIGKKMNAKLRQYKHGYDDGWYLANKDDGKEIDDDEDAG